MRDDQHLNHVLRWVFCEERPDSVDVGEGKSVGSGHGSDVGGAGQSIFEDYAQVPRCRQRQCRDILNSE